LLNNLATAKVLLNNLATAKVLLNNLATAKVLLNKVVTGRRACISSRRPRLLAVRDNGSSIPGLYRDETTRWVVLEYCLADFPDVHEKK
jgi:hypothetical protein